MHKPEANHFRDQKRQLRQILGPGRIGSRTCIPVIGAGLNMQAARIAGETEDNWSGLLERIAGAMGMTRRSLEKLSSCNLAQWESMLRLWARKKGVEPSRAEVELQKFTCEHLRKQEARASRWDLYREFAGAGFQDILSLNFDRRIALSWDRPRFVSGPARCPEGSQGETLYRHDELMNSQGCRTRIWYPHGDTRKFSTLKLGVRRYGFYIVTIEESRRSFGDMWRYKRPWYRSMWEQFDRPPSDAPRWVEPFLGRTVIFIGCGLSLDEWPLWWMIRQRALTQRNPPPTYHVGAGPAPVGTQEHAFRQYGIQAIRFGGFEEMWEAIREAIA